METFRKGPASGIRDNSAVQPTLPTEPYAREFVCGSPPSESMDHLREQFRGRPLGVLIPVLYPIVGWEISSAQRWRESRRPLCACYGAVADLRRTLAWAGPPGFRARCFATPR